MRKQLNQKGLAGVIELLVVLVVLSGLGYVGWRVYKKSHNSTGSSSSTYSDKNAIAAGKELSGNRCTGSGSSTLTKSPMNADDFAFIIPYGLVVGGHVTPIDHQYFSPTVFNSAPDTYPVYAMADAQITDIEVHPTRIRLVFTVSCTFFYYYDLVTSVEPGIDKEHLPITVKAGQLIGHVGGQTLDFAVWDTTKPLKGFIVPEQYKAEPWKIYTADPLDYYSDDLKTLALSKYIRTEEPLSGKIDYDVDGRLIGNWFEVGTNGYAGKDRSKYWDGHLSFAPDLYDPSTGIISVGYLAPANGGPDNQFSVLRSSPDFADVSASTNLVKYELKPLNYITGNGESWNMTSFPSGGLKVDNDNKTSKGCALVQMTDSRKLKFETFIGKSCDSVSSFSSPREYER